MTNQNEMAIMTADAKKIFLEMCQQRAREIGRRQREYKKILGTRLKSREDTIFENSLHYTIENLQTEKNDLRAQIYVATGTTHVTENNRALKEIHCHVNCQDHLSSDIQKLKVQIANIEREIGRVDRQVYNLNQKTIPDSQFEQYCAHELKLMNILENQLETGIKRECAMAATNAQLREELEGMLHHRAFFNETYTKKVMKLNSDKKYLIDLIEYAGNQFENCIEIQERMLMVTLKDRKERELRKVEMQSIMRELAASEDITEFMTEKTKYRPLADLQPKEYRRREKFRKQHNRKINLYNDVLEKILGYTESNTVEEVIEKFQQQESIYYSYFSYANEMSFHMTLLNNAVNRLFDNVQTLKVNNKTKYNQQLETIAELEQRLEEKERKNMELDAMSEASDNRLETLLMGIQEIFATCRANPAPLMELLGDHTKVNLVNMRRFLKLLEKRLQDIVAYVYVTERAEKKKNAEHYVVKDVEKIFEFTTHINDIVLTQQCPECAEGEAINNVEDTGEGGPIIHSVDEAKYRLFEKVRQPEMQYRLHSISQCRLPRSRVLAAKRYG